MSNPNFDGIKGFKKSQKTKGIISNTSHNQWNKFAKATRHRRLNGKKVK